MRELHVTLPDDDTVTKMFQAFETVVNCGDPKPSSAAEELGVIIGNLSDDGNVSSSGTIIHIEVHKGTDLKPLRALCKAQGWRVE